MLTEDIIKYHKLVSIISYAVMGIVIIYVITIEIFKNATALEPLLDSQTVMLAKIVSFLIAVSIFGVIKQISKAKLKDENNKTPEEFLQNMFFVDMIKAAIFEVPAFIGFILFFLTGAYVEFYILAAFSIFLVISNFPKTANWTKELNRKFNGETHHAN